MIPERERGYSVEADSVTVHERYQDHAPRAMRTSALGVSNIAKGRNLVACETCFPAPKAKRVKEHSPDINGQHGGEAKPRSSAVRLTVSSSDGPVSAEVRASDDVDLQDVASVLAEAIQD